jgi:ACS family tartrate transporter-like MFS transporter
MSQETSSPALDTLTLRRKVFWRIVPLIFVLYIVAFLDRANLGFAKLAMSEDRHFSEAVFGWAIGIFFAGYLLLQVPGALLVEHWSARKLFACILVPWGVCSMGMALATQPWQLYLARFLLGLTEAAFFPGVIVYFTHWFPRADRGRAMAGLVLGIPLCLAVGAQVSGQLMRVNWFGLAGWQWVFLVEGFPAVVLGVIVLFLLNDRPRDARWLTSAERDWLENTLDEERKEKAAARAVTLGQALRQPTVWLLALGIMAANMGGYAMLFWLPTAMKSLLVVAGREATNTAVLNWLAVVHAFGLPGVCFVGWSSDRSGERKWHCVAGLVLVGSFLAASVVPGQSWAWVFTWLCLVGFFANFWPPPFWVLPTLTLSASAAAVSIAFINICATVAGLIGSPIVGELKTRGVDDATCLRLLSSCYVAGGLILALVQVPPRKTSHPGCLMDAK